MMRTTIFLLFVLVGLALAKSDFTQAQNPDRLAQARPEAKKLFDENGFVAQPTDYTQLYEMYKSIRKADQPMLVTTDCVLHSFHVLFDYTLRDVETRYFEPDLKELTSTLFKYERRLLAGAKPAETRDALNANLAFLSVAAALLDSGFVVPAKVAKTVKAELALIDAHQGIARSPLMGFDEDYSQYAPRGHYTRSELLKRYFKAMMWYGRIGFALKPGNREKDIELGRKLTYQALLLCDALRQAKVGADTALTVWARVYEPTVLLVGKSDDLSVKDYLGLLAQTFGDKNPLPDRPSDAQLDRFINLALALPSPKIVSQPVPDTVNPAQTTKGLRLMGQRYIPDSYMFQELVYDKVGTQQDPRTMPKGLDVFAALGSDEARRILKEQYHQDRYQNYEAQLDKLQKEFDELTPNDWNQNVYFGWLYALKLQNEPVPANKLLADFAFVPAYADKCLVTVSGSWAQLRHDTILYAKQSYTMLATAMPTQPKEDLHPVVYVEPKPAVFAQVVSLVGQMMQGLKQYGVLSDDANTRLDELSVMSGSLQSIAEKESKGELPKSGELQTAWHVGDQMEDFARFPGEGTTNDEDRNMATVADVHTDPNTNTALEVAVGAPLGVLALVPFEGKSHIAEGGMFSYYEFTKPISERMTDAQWQGMKDRPTMPEWTGSFVAQ
jgi:hypothetical protein